MNKKTRFITQSAIIGTLYVVLTYVSSSLGLASGMIQIRISEALTILPAFSSSGVWGLFIGCLCANLLTGAPLPDIIFGSLATLLGALGTRAFGKNAFWAAFFPILSNTVIIPLVLKFAYGLKDGYFLLAFFIFLGEAASCGLLGAMLYKVI